MKLITELTSALRELRWRDEGFDPSYFLAFLEIIEKRKRDPEARCLYAELVEAIRGLSRDARGRWGRVAERFRDDLEAIWHHARKNGIALNRTELAFVMHVLRRWRDEARRHLPQTA